MQTPVTVVILAAGLGTRMKSRKAKVLHRAGGKTLVRARGGHGPRSCAPPERIFVVVGHQADEVRSAVATPGIGFIEQTEQKGTGHAAAGRPRSLGGLGRLSGDRLRRWPAAARRDAAPADRHARKSDGGAGTLLSAMMDDPTGYGRVIRDCAAGMPSASWSRRPARPNNSPSAKPTWGSTAIAPTCSGSTSARSEPNNPANEYYLTDMVEILNRAGHNVGAMHIDDPSEVLGINNRVELAEVDRIFRERKVRELMLAGVTIEKPETVTIDADVRIGMDTVIEPFAQILGKTHDRRELPHRRRARSCRIRRSRTTWRSAPFTIVGDSRVGARRACWARSRGCAWTTTWRRARTSATSWS